MGIEDQKSHMQNTRTIWVVSNDFQRCSERQAEIIEEMIVDWNAHGDDLRAGLFSNG